MSSSKISNTILDDLSEDLFAEILCRLPDPKHVVRCKFVSKRWRRLVRNATCDSNFISLFIRFRRDSKTPILRTLLNHEGIGFRVAKGEELLTTMKMKAEEVIATVTMEVEKLLNLRRTKVGNDEALITTADFTTIMTIAADRSLRPISSKPLTPLFKRLIARTSRNCYYGLASPVVVATYNDLVLCGNKTGAGSDEYQIYNPYTEESVTLPYAPSIYEFCKESMIVEAVGFICDLDKSGSRCKVVKIYGEVRQSYSELKAQIFSFETGVWRESIVSFSQQIPGLIFDIVIYPYNGMLYWKADNKTFVGFDPFMINSANSDGGDTLDHYKGRIIELSDKNAKSETEFVGVCGGRLRFIDDFISHELPVWELEEEEDERAHDRSGKLVLKCTRYSLDREMFRDRDLMYRCTTGHDYWLVFDPNDENVLYVNNTSHSLSRLVFRCNIRTTEWSKVPYMSYGRDFVFQLTVLPWWPTPVPIIKNKYAPYDPVTNDAMRYFATY